MLLSTFWFALMNVMVKKLSYLPSMEVVFFRCAVASIIGFALLKNQHVSWVGTNRKLLFLRGLFGTIALYTFFLTLKHMPMALVVVLHFQLFGAVAGAVFTLFEYQAPIATDWIYIVLIGIVTQLGQYYLTKSLQAEKIAKVSILNYLGIIYALFFGWWLFDEHQHLSTLFGILLVVGGVVINILIANKKSTN